jgi:predicted transcriptional regulator
MRRQIICLEQNKTIGHGINTIIKHKVNALLIVDDQLQEVGVVSKTDIMGAYYAGLPIDSPLEYIMLSPPQDAIKKMILTDIHRLFVYEGDENALIGVLSLTDALRGRSGSYHGCVSSRIKIEDHEN